MTSESVSGDIMTDTPPLTPRETVVLTGFIVFVVWLVGWAVAGL